MSQTGKFESEAFKKNIVDSLSEVEKFYTTGDDAYDANRGKTMTAIAGPTGSGKTTVTSEVIRIDSDFKEVNTTTTRPHRDGNPEGFRTGVSYQEMYDAATNQHLVNFNVIGKNIYGTYPEGFPGRHNIGPIMARSVPQFVNAGFDDFNVIYMVPEELEYERRLRAERVDFVDFTPRVIEGDASLDFAEANAGENWLHFVESSSEPGSALKAARKIIDIVHHNSGEFMTTPHALKMLEGMRSALHRVANDVH